MNDNPEPPVGGLPERQPPEAPAQSLEKRPSRSPGAQGRTAVLVALLSLVVTIALWWQIRTDVASMQRVQQQLAADVAALRPIPSVDVTGAPALGPEDAVVTLIEFSDYECPFCIRHFNTTMPLIEEAFIRTGQIRYVFRDLPIAQLHPGASRAHEASRCAAEQGRFWQVHPRLFSAPGTHSDTALEAVAVEAGLDIEAFHTCLTSERMRPGVEASVGTAASLGAAGTPFFVVGIRNLQSDQVDILHSISGAQPFETFDKAIRAVAARVR